MLIKLIIIKLQSSACSVTVLRRWATRASPTTKASPAFTTGSAGAITTSWTSWFALEPTSVHQTATDGKYFLLLHYLVLALYICIGGGGKCRNQEVAEVSMRSRMCSVRVSPWCSLSLHQMMFPSCWSSAAGVRFWSWLGVSEGTARVGWRSTCGETHMDKETKFDTQTAAVWSSSRPGYFWHNVSTLRCI